MGCSSIKENIENEMIKLKMERIELRHERRKQLQLLKDKYGCDFKPSNIPDYYDCSEFTVDNQNNKKKNSVSIIKKPKLVAVKPKRSKSISIQRKRSINSKDTNDIIKLTQKTIKKKKTLKF